MCARRFLPGLVAVLLAALLLVLWNGGRGAVTHEGRSGEAWFAQAVRHVWAEAPRSFFVSHDTRRAFRAMGTNALPFLVDRALDVRPTSAVRSNLHRLFLRVPEWAGRGRFAPLERQPILAIGFVRDIRPPLPVLPPLLEPALAGTNAQVRSRALELLGGAEGDPAAAMPHLLRALRLPDHGSPDIAAERRAAANTLRALGIRSADALPAVIEALDRPSRDIVVENALLGWLIQLGPDADVALPQVESLMEQPRSHRRVLAALAAHAMQPGHSTAQQILREAAEDAGQPGNMGRFLAGYLHVFGWPDAVLADLVEPLAVVEMEAWNPASSTHSAILALERTAPDRARRLYESVLATDAGLTATYRLILLDGMHRMRHGDLDPLEPAGSAGPAAAERAVMARPCLAQQRTRRGRARVRSAARQPARRGGRAAGAGTDGGGPETGRVTG